MIDLHNISKRFASITAVDNVSLSIRTGEFLTLLGPSGCGKTTLLRLIAGFESPDQGRILLDNQDVTSLPPYRRDVNQVFQSYALFPHLTVAKNIAFGLKMKRLPKSEISSRVADALSTVELTGLEHRKPHQLSGGQRQRVALARALVNRPKVLLLDEPLAALDAKLRHSMQLELKRLQQRLGITFVFVTHDQSEALIMSDRVAVMHAGQIQQLATPHEIYHHPTTPFVAQFVGQSNILQVQLLTPTRARIKDLELTLPTPINTETATLLIRPESITLTPTKESRAVPGPSLSSATLTEILFTGPTTHLRLQTPGGLELLATLPPNTPHPQIGQPLTFTIPPQQITLLPSDNALPSSTSHGRPAHALSTPAGLPNEWLALTRSAILPARSDGNGEANFHDGLQR
ncbi:MAG TPA: ABC transporter ATP-binding protein [Tepidisphaeraceae bacterium]|jgi:spermidine/putrescine transport system ATP-binding protein|nr:ABC transporter ATP-binding protein [Tepidisphaeraceae bacterium]